MKTTIQKELFLNSLATASKFTSSRISGGSNIQGVLLEQKKKTLYITSTNLSSFFHIELAVEGGEDFRCVVDHHKLLEFLSYLDNKQVFIFVQDNKLFVVQEKTKGAFPVFSQAEIPLPPQDFFPEKEIEGKETGRIIESVLFSSSKDLSRPVLSGVFFTEKENGGVDVVTTDGFRLSLMRVEKGMGFKNVLIPAEFLFEMLKYARGEEKVFFSEAKKEKMICIRVGRASFFTRLIEGEFPPYERVIPIEKRATATIEREVLVKNIKAIAVFARDFSSIVLCTFSSGRLVLSPKTEAGKENTAEQDIQYEGEEMRVAFNFKFILEYLQKTDTDEVVVELLRPDAPVVFKTKKDKNLVHIIMPVRIQE